MPDLNCYTALRNDDDYSSWWKAFKNTAALQGFKQQLDENWVPSTDKEKEIFSARNMA